MDKRQTGEPVKTSRSISEGTAIGVQYLMPEIAPITQNDRMAQKCAAPLVASNLVVALSKRKTSAHFFWQRSKCKKHPFDTGLFDRVQRNQIDLLDYLRTARHSPTISPATRLNPTKNQQE